MLVCVCLCVLVGEHKECLKYVEGGGCIYVWLGGRAGAGRGDSLTEGTKHAAKLALQQRRMPFAWACQGSAHVNLDLIAWHG